MTDRFHQAAKDDRLSLLKQATKKDLNQKDDSGMTPTLWAAYHGNIEALRLCCSRGGDPDKCDYIGNTALHFVSANGHLNCLRFLVSFGANIWQMDNDYHTIMDVAAIRQKQDCIKFLDDVIAKQKSLDKKKVESLQEKAKKDAERRIKLYRKMQQDQQKILSKLQDRQNSETSGNTGVGRQKKTSVTNANGGQNYSQSTYGSKPSTQMRISKQKMNTASSYPSTDGFHVSGLDGGRRTVNSLEGLQSNVHAGVMYKQSETMSQTSGQDGLYNGQTKRKMLREVFPDQQSATSAPRSNDTVSVFGTIALRTNFRSANAMYSAALDSEKQVSADPELGTRDFNGNGAANSLMSFPTGTEDPYQPGSEDDDNDFLNGLEEPTGLDTFLASLDLSEHSQIFKEQKVDLDVLMDLTPDDLKELGLVLGVRKKIINATKERKDALESLREMELTKF